MPGQKILGADRKRIDPKFICVECGLLLSTPMQTPCGHLLCYVCLQSILSSSNRACPSDGTQLTMEEVFPDAFTRRELMGLKLNCPNTGCDWFGTNKELQDHSSNCDYSLIKCVHAQCKKEIRRSLLGKHLDQECEYRLVKCPHCKEELRFILLEEHVLNKCLKVPLPCKHCGKTGIPRTEMKKHEMVECEEILAECEFKAIGCVHDKVTKRNELRQHFSDGLIIHLRLLLNFVLDLFGKVQHLIPMMEITTKVETVVDELKQRTESLSNAVKTLRENFTSILKRIAGLEKRVEIAESRTGASREDPKRANELKNMESRIVDLKNDYEKVVERNRRIEIELQEKTSIIERLRTKLDQIDHSMALMTVELSDLESSKESQPTPSFNGTLLWKIDGFHYKRRDAVNGVQTAIYSPYFYSSQFGYKMCARIYLNGDGVGKGTHISLFFVVMKGEYDALVQWPFQKKITMMLLDQNNRDHMVDSFRSDPASSSFQRPKSKMNIASGSPLFMPLDGLSNRAYVSEDTMFIKFIVD